MLDQDPDEPLVGAVERAVDDVQRMLGVVRPHVREAEARGHLRVELDRAHLPFPSERVLHVEVDLRPVERALSLGDLVRDLVPFERDAQGAFRHVPLLVAAELVLGPRGELALAVRPNSSYR